MFWLAIYAGWVALVTLLVWGHLHLFHEMSWHGDVQTAYLFIWLALTGLFIPVGLFYWISGLLS
jgi:hypothetical protein